MLYTDVNAVVLFTELDIGDFSNVTYLETFTASLKEALATPAGVPTSQVDVKVEVHEGSGSVAVDLSVHYYSTNDADAFVIFLRQSYTTIFNVPPMELYGNVELSQVATETYLSVTNPPIAPTSPTPTAPGSISPTLATSPLPTTSPTAPPAIIPKFPLPVDFVNPLPTVSPGTTLVTEVNATVFFSALDISNFDDASYYGMFVTRFQIAVGASAGVSPNLVSVLDIYLGSTVVDFRVTFDTTAIGSPSAFVEVLQKNVGAVFSSEAWSEAGNVKTTSIKSWTYKSVRLPPTQPAAPTSTMPGAALTTLPIIPPEAQTGATGDGDIQLSWMISLLVAIALAVTLAGVILYVYCFNRRAWWNAMEKLATSLAQKHFKSNSKLTGLNLRLNDCYEDDDLAGPSTMSPLQVITDPKSPHKSATHQNPELRMYQNPEYQNSECEFVPALQAQEQTVREDELSKQASTSSGKTRSGYPLKHKDSLRRDQKRANRQSSQDVQSKTSQSSPPSSHCSSSLSASTRTSSLHVDYSTENTSRGFTSTIEGAKGAKYHKKRSSAELLSKTKQLSNTNPLFLLDAFTNPSYAPVEEVNESRDAPENELPTKNPTFGSKEYTNPSFDPEPPDQVPRKQRQAGNPSEARM